MPGDGDRGHASLPDQPELYGVRDTRSADAWQSLLQRYPAHVFATLTFRQTKRYTDKFTGEVREVPRVCAGGGMHPEAADKAFRFFVSSLNRELFGASWHRKWHGGIQWARGQEFHKDGRLHFHALLSAPTDDLNRLCSRYRWHEWWYREFGRNQLEVPASQADVAAYVSKYVTKGGEVDFSRNFGAWIPPPPTFVTRPHQTALPGADSNTPAPVDSRQAAHG